MKKLLEEYKKISINLLKTSENIIKKRMVKDDDYNKSSIINKIIKESVGRKKK